MAGQKLAILLFALAAVSANGYVISIDWSPSNDTMLPIASGCRSSLLISWKSTTPHSLMLSKTGIPCGDTAADVLVQASPVATFLWQPDTDGNFVLFSSVGDDCTAGNMMIPVTIVGCSGTGPTVGSMNGTTGTGTGAAGNTTAPAGKSPAAKTPAGKASNTTAAGNSTAPAGKAGRNATNPAAKATGAANSTSPQTAKNASAPAGKLPPPSKSPAPKSPAAGGTAGSAGTGGSTAAADVAAAKLMTIPWVNGMDPMDLTMQCKTEGIKLTWDDGNTDIYMDSVNECTFDGGQTLVQATTSYVFDWVPMAAGTYVFKSTIADNCDAGGMKVALTVTC